jgi:hypothetical protein
MSGRRINDMGGEPHTSDMAMKSGNKLKHYTSAEGSGHLGMDYHDTTEGIKEDQMKGDSKIKGHKIKPGYRY